MLTSDIQFSKARSSITFTDEGITMLVSDLQNKKVLVLIDCIDDEISTLESNIHPEKAYSPILVTDEGILILTSDLQFLNAPTPILLLMMEL